VKAAAIGCRGSFAGVVAEAEAEAGGRCAAPCACVGVRLGRGGVERWGGGRLAVARGGEDTRLRAGGGRRPPSSRFIAQQPHPTVVSRSRQHSLATGRGLVVVVAPAGWVA
jgi:hypothetical protein